MKKIGIKVGKILGLVLLVFVAAIAAIIFIKGKGKPITLVDKDGNTYVNGVSVREKVQLNDSEQYVFIAGENKDNPVLLFLHGGPGSPEVAMFDFKPGERLEERFTVCYWEQRGSGLSYEARLDSDQMTVDLMVSDTIALTEYLQKRFNQEKIYIMGHSWGTFLGTKAISEKPEYYKAYFGIGQIANQKKSEKLAYEYMIAHAEEIKDEEAQKILNKFDPDAADFPSMDYFKLARNKYMNQYGIGIMHKTFSMFDLLKKTFFFEGYSALDFIHLLRGMQSGSEGLISSIAEENLMETTNKFDIPIYILHGAYDYQVSYTLAKEYFNLISAPHKEFFTFEQSAHSPNFEENEKFLSVVFSKLDQLEK